MVKVPIPAKSRLVKAGFRPLAISIPGNWVCMTDPYGQRVTVRCCLRSRQSSHHPGRANRC